MSRCNMSKITYYLCPEKGHISVKCPKLTDMQEAYKNSQPKANLASNAMIIDSGTTQHMFNQLDIFEDITPRESHITCANAQRIKSIHIRTVEVNNTGVSETLRNVLYAPELQYNLVSVRALTKDGKDVLFKQDGTVETIDENNYSHKIGQTIGDLYQMDDQNALTTIARSANMDEYALWHHRFRHMG